jgi:hypothetical protein
MPARDARCVTGKGTGGVADNPVQAFLKEDNDNVVARGDPNGAVVERSVYDPYGAVLTPARGNRTEKR